MEIITDLFENGITMYHIWLIGSLFTTGFMSAANHLIEKRDPDSALSKWDSILVFLTALIAWPYLLGGAVAMLLTNKDDES